MAFIAQEYRVFYSQILKIRSCLMALVNISFGLLFLSLVLDSFAESRRPYSTHQFRKTQLRHQRRSFGQYFKVCLDKVWIDHIDFYWIYIYPRECNFSFYSLKSSSWWRVVKPPVLVSLAELGFCNLFSINFKLDRISLTFIICLNIFLIV